MTHHRSKRTDLGLLALRAGVGGTLFAHGAQKLFGWFGGYGLEATGGAMESMGFAPGKRSALMAGLGEAGGGAALALGLATPAAGAAAAATMTTAGTVHGPAGFWVTDGGFEYNAVLATVGSALAVAGPGRYSLDHALGHKLDKPWMAAVALPLFGLAAAHVITQRRKAVAAAAAQQQTSGAEQVAAAEQAESTGA
ncbi:DoxX family membrane protein [Pseudokineococcus marinus]|uniref:DoxX family membrane protein n=1 Tax=Pseudokineococcus marinus TaxID=351215 RepID=A0A849BM86_9ACTN|nr:DoxX family membrane protein [Pseudokineococcus marinus]NNH21744.1 DoxX family membrane protein [Pseudokineococcus marinus]